MEQKSSGRNTAEGVEMSKSKQQIVDEITQMNDACSFVLDGCQPASDPRAEATRIVFTDYDPLYPSTYPSVNSVINKLFGPNNNDGWISELATEVSTMQAETVTEYVVREEPVMSKLNLILSSC